MWSRALWRTSGFRSGGNWPNCCSKTCSLLAVCTLTNVNGGTIGHTSLSHQVLCLLELWLPIVACYLLLVPKKVLPLQSASSLVIGQITSGFQDGPRAFVNSFQGVQLLPPRPQFHQEGLLDNSSQRPDRMDFFPYDSLIKLERGKRSYSPTAYEHIPLWIPIQTCLGPESARCSTPCLSSKHFPFFTHGVPVMLHLTSQNITAPSFLWQPLRNLKTENTFSLKSSQPKQPQLLRQNIAVGKL